MNKENLFKKHLGITSVDMVDKIPKPNIIAVFGAWRTALIVWYFSNSAHNNTKVHYAQQWDEMYGIFNFELSCVCLSVPPYVGLSVGSICVFESCSK